MKKILIVILLFVGYCSSYGQNLNATLKSADNAFKQQNYYGAARLYEDILKHNNKFHDIHYSAAEAYRLDNDYVRAIPHYKYVVEKAKKHYPLAEFYLASMYKSNEDYFSAQFYFTNYYKQHKSDSSNFYTIKAKQEIIFCEKAINLKYNHTGTLIQPVDTTINSLYSEFGACTMGDSILLYSSVKSNNGDSASEFISSIYYSKYDGHNFSVSEKLPNSINTEGFHNANPYFDNETQRLFFTRKGKNPNAKTYIMMSEYKNNMFNDAIALCSIINDSTSNNTHATISHIDNKTILWFASDRKEGMGGYDIYYAELDENFNAKKVQLAGVPPEVDNAYIAFFGIKSNINSQGNELSPFYNAKDKTLYFSSDWYAGLGGYDIFKSKTDLSTWAEPQNLGYPTNSGQNDIYYFQDNKWGMAFLTSNRKEARALKHQSCCNDIFSHNTEKIVPIELIVTQQVTILTLEASELIPITLFFDNDQPNPNSWDTVTSINYTDAYEAYIAQQKLFETEFSKSYRGNEKTALIDSIARFFDNEVIGEYQKLTKFASLLKELVQKGQVIEVTIKGYTSPLHSTEYNEVLAKRRISSIENFFYEYDNGFFIPYIESKKIIISRLAFGKTMVRGNVSDDPRDRRNSVFSPAASAERKVQIVAVSVNKEN